MACCAFAVFLLGQLYIAFEALGRVLGLSWEATDRPTATDWYPGAPTMAAVRGRPAMPTMRWRVAAGVSVTVTAIVVMIAVRPSDPSSLSAYIAEHTHYCGALFTKAIG